MSGFDARSVPPLLAAYLRDTWGERPPYLPIHPRDEMLAFLTTLHGGDRDQGLVAYYDSGRRILRAFEQIVAWRFGGWDRIGRLLDFASGLGRVTRLLVRELPPERVWISEILPEAVAFQGERLGVHAVASSPRPEDLALGERFDAIFVTSLFTHLPAATFAAWLRRLAGLLVPDGLLVVSTHDLSLLPPEERPAGGFRFEPVSESRQLDREDYGSTWVSEDWMGARLAELGLAWRRLPRGLCNFQDLYLATPGAADFASLDFRHDLEGYVEAVRITPDDGLFLRGWVADFSGRNPPAAVRVELDGALIGVCTGFGRRRDVAAAYHLDGERASGWELACPFPDDGSRSARRLAIRARAAGGEDRLLHLSTLEGALLWSAERELDALRRELAETRAAGEAEARLLTRHIQAMEASRFWKLRNRWFALKGALGRGGGG